MPDDPAALEALRRKYAPQAAPVDKFAALKAKYAPAGVGADSRIAAASKARTATYGDVPDEGQMPVEDADRVALLERFGSRRKVEDPGMLDTFYGTVDTESRARQQAAMDTESFAGFEKQAGPVKTKADVRRLREAADLYEANQAWRRENPGLGVTSLGTGGIAPVGVEAPPKFTDPMEARRYLDEAPDRRRARYEYESEGKFPFMQALARRAALGATAGQFDIAKTFGSDQERRLVGEAEALAGKGGQTVLGMAETAGMMSPVGRGAALLAPTLIKQGFKEGTALAAANLIAGSIHGGVSEGSVEGAARTGLFMGGQSALGRVFRGAAPTAGRYAASELGAGATASLIAQMVTEGQADPVKALADGVVNALFGIGGARAAGRARRAESEAVVEAARQRVMEEIRKGRELQDILRDQDFAAMVRAVEPTPGDPEAMLADLPPPVDPMELGRQQREAAKASIEPVEAPLELPKKRAIPPDESMVAFLGRMHDASGIGKPGGSDLNRVLRERFGITEDHADLILLRAATEGAIPKEIAEFQGVGLRRRNFRGRGPERVAAAEAGIVDAQGKPKWDLFSREAPPAPDDLLFRLSFFPGDRVTAPGSVEEGLRLAGPTAARKPVSEAPVRSIDPTEARYVPSDLPTGKGKKPKAPEAVSPEESAARLADAEAPARVTAPEIPVEPAPRPGKAGERGAVDVSGMAEGAARGVRSLLGTETQKIRDLGTPSARELADLLEKADDVRQERSGPITPARRKVEIFASRPSGMGAARSLTRPDIVRSTVDGESVVYALPRGEQIINGKTKARTPEESRLVQLIEDYWQERGKGFEAVGTMRTDPKTGEPVPFVTPKGVWPRVPHRDGIDLMLAGNKDKAWKPFVRAVADANGMPVEAAERILTKMRERMIGLSGVTGPETGRVSEAEVFRELPNMPSDIYVRTRLGPRRISILETDPSVLVRRATDMGTSRMGVIKAFGQDMGEGSKVDDLRRRFISENAGRGIDPTKVWDKAIRMAHAIPKNDALISPSHPLAPVARGFKSFFNLIKTMRMSNRWASNIFEWTGAPREFVGLGNQAKVQWQRIRDLFKTGEGREAVARDLERRGAIIDEGLALPADPSNPFSQATNIIKQVLDTVSLGRPMESSQEHGFARGADTRLKIMQARKGQGESHNGERDVLRLMQIGVPEAQARKLAYGNGTQAEYDTALRTAMNKGIGANTSQLSRSPLENSRVGKALWYNSWASMNLRHSARTMLTTIRGVQSAFAPGLSPEARVRRLGAATRTFFSWAAGRTVSNAAATAAVSFITGGTTGLSANLSAAKDDLAGFLTNSFLYGIVGGPYAAIIRNADENLGRQIEGVATPIAVVHDMIDAITGRGRYTDKHGMDRVYEIGQTYLPFIKSLFSAKSAITGDTTRLNNEAAEKAYRDWRRDSGLYKKSPNSNREPSDYRAAVWKITDLIEAGKMDEARAEFDKARSIKAPKGRSLAKSIMDQRLLTISDMKRNAVDDTNPAEAVELMKALRRHIGDTAYRMLEERDARIMEFLGTVGKGR